MSVTVHDRVSFTARVTPEQAAAYVRAKLPGWKEHRVPRHGEPWMILFDRPDGLGQLGIPADATFADYARRMVELCDALVALGCAQQPSQVLAAMVAIEVSP